MIQCAYGCMLGQLVGDALGSPVEFKTPEQIRSKYPNGIRTITGGGRWDTIAGQPTDDSEMALMLARMLAESGRYDKQEAKKAYVFWLRSGPFDCGMSIAGGLKGNANKKSQANGAMMRVSPLGILGAKHKLTEVGRWACLDATITHPHPVCQQANSLYAMAISYAIRQGCGPRSLYRQIVTWAEVMVVEEPLLNAIKRAATAPPKSYVHQEGWVITAFGNALWQLLNAPNFEEALVDTVMQGGDTDTNAAICGALLGAVWGQKAIPSQWVESVLNCRPASGQASVRLPRPKCFWPVDAMRLTERLLSSE